MGGLGTKKAVAVSSSTTGTTKTTATKTTGTVAKGGGFMSKGPAKK